VENKHDHSTGADCQPLSTKMTNDNGPTTGRGRTVGPERRVLSLARFRPGNDAFSSPRNSRDASAPSRLFSLAEIGAIVGGVKVGEFDYAA
jgi:hypothetical protein